MSFLQNGQAYLNRTMAEAAGVTGGLTIYRPSMAQVTPGVTAWVGRTVFKQTPSHGQAGAQVIWGERDYLIPVASYVFGGVAVLPQRGDRYTDPDVPGATFELMAPGNEPAWRYSDQTRTLLRVHVKRVS